MARQFLKGKRNIRAHVGKRQLGCSYCDTNVKSGAGAKAFHAIPHKRRTKLRVDRVDASLWWKPRRLILIEREPKTTSQSLLTERTALATWYAAGFKSKDRLMVWRRPLASRGLSSSEKGRQRPRCNVGRQVILPLTVRWLGLSAPWRFHRNIETGSFCALQQANVFYTTSQTRISW